MDTKKPKEKSIKKTRYFIGEREYTLTELRGMAKKHEGCAALFMARKEERGNGE
ncbi:MAG: hypothetical protein VB082_02980 [Christensenella sp.]|nr:hypothetical protein [Christensenella sp.]